VSLDARLIVASCPRYRPIQELWLRCLNANWRDCPFPVTIISPENDIGWNANLIRGLEAITEPLVILFMDDSCIDAVQDGNPTDNVNAVVELMSAHPDIAMVKLQAGGAHAPELPCPEWDRLREYDRASHPFKRTNLGGPAMYRRDWLHRLSSTVLSVCGPERDKGRSGAIEFEMTGSLLTKDANAWPERLLAIHRPDADGSGGRSLLSCTGNDAVTGGKVREIASLRQMCEGIPGIEVFL
jgi:hypothetical protein